MRCSLVWVAIGVASAWAGSSLPAAAQLVFEPQVVGSPTGATYSPRLDLGDLDGDGDLDAVVFTGSDSLFYAYEVLLNDGTGALAPASKVPVTEGFNALRLADLDGDDRLDLISAHGDAVRLRRGQGDGSFGAPQVIYTPTSPTVFRIEVAELTGDAHPDLVALQGGLVAVLPGVGDGSLAAPIPVADLLTEAAYAARAADLDGDGAVDLVVLARDDSAPGAPTSKAHVFLATGAGGFTTAGVYDLGANADIELLLLDDDDIPDLASASHDGLAIRRGLGTGDFESATLLDAGAFETGLTGADFDGDGDLDLAAVDPATVELVFWQGTEGEFEPGLRLSGTDPLGIEGEAPFVLRALQAADMDGDGRPDVVRIAGDTFGQVLVSVFRNHTYGRDDAFLDLGHALADPGLVSPGDVDVPGLLLATPILLADGSLQPGTLAQFSVLRHGVESDHAWLVLGLGAQLQPLHGGTLVPSIDGLVGPLAFSTFNGVAELPTVMPTDMPSGFQFWLQAWFVPSAPQQDFAATSAVLCTVP